MGAATDCGLPTRVVAYGQNVLRHVPDVVTAAVATSSASSPFAITANYAWGSTGECPNVIARTTAVAIAIPTPEYICFAVPLGRNEKLPKAGVFATTTSVTRAVSAADEEEIRLTVYHHNAI